MSDKPNLDKLAAQIAGEDAQEEVLPDPLAGSNPTYLNININLNINEEVFRQDTEVARKYLQLEFEKAFRKLVRQHKGTMY